MKDNRRENSKTGTEPVKIDKKRANRSIAYVTYAFVLLFLVLIVYIVYYTIFRGPEDINNSYNSRQDIYAKRVVRGQILSRNGDILAKSVTDESGREEREYPYGPLFAHAVGFSEKGKLGVEANANIRLLTSNRPLTERVINDFRGEKNLGNDVYTTLDPDIQRAAYDALGSYKGAVIATDIKTGEILCMVSKPDFDPNLIEEEWDEINSDQKKGALLNRVTQGLYPPGSTFKIVTTLEYLKEHEDIASEYSFECNGSFSYEGSKINCYHDRSHGEVDLLSSFSRSCNASYANISTTLDKEAFRNTCEELLFNKDLPLKMSYKQSYVPINNDSSADELMQTAIGQGKTQMTPIHINIITSAIANNGVLMRPYIIDRIEKNGGGVIRQYAPDEYGRIIDEKYCLSLREMMEEVVKSGTGTRLSETDGYTAAGKTGSAEYSSNKVMSHAWFTGYAPCDDPQIAVTVIAEEAGSGGEMAVPIAKKVFDAWAASVVE